MKRFLAALFLICLIAGGLWYYLQPPAVRVSAGRFLPPHTLFTLEIHELEKSFQEFKKSRLGKNLAKLDIADLMKQLGAEEEKVSNYREGEHQLLSAINNKGFMELFGKELHIAFLPTDHSIKKPEDILSKIILIAYPRRNTDFIELAGAFFSGNTEVNKSAYKGQTLKSIKLDDGLLLNYCFADGVMLAGFDPEVIKAALDRQSGGGENLLDHKEYGALRRKIFNPQSRSFAYFNIEGIKNGLKEIVSENKPQGEDQEKARAIFEKQFSLYEGFRSLAYSSYNDGVDKSERVLINLESDKLTAGQKATYLVEPGENHTLPLVPADTLFYNWVNNLEIKESLNDYLSREGMPDHEIAELYRKIEQMTGATIERIDEIIGGEFALLITDINTGSLFPVPVFAFMAQVEETEFLETFLASLAGEAGMVFEREDHEGREIKHLMLPFGSDIQPAYTFYEGFWIVAINPGLIKEMIAARESGKGIRSNESFKSVNKGLTEKNNNISYVRIDRFAEKIAYIAEWGKNMLAMKGPEVAKKGTLIVNEVVNPILDGLKMYEAMGSRSFIRGETIEVNSFIKMEKSTI